MEVQIKLLKYFQTLITLIFLFVFVACENNCNKNTFKEFIFAQIASLKIDSSGKPVLMLEKYYELDSTKIQNIAYSSTNSIKNGLDCFCILNDNSIKIYDSINKYFDYFYKDSINEILPYEGEGSCTSDTNRLFRSIGKKKLDYFVIYFKTFENTEKFLFYTDTSIAINQIIKNINLLILTSNCKNGFFEHGSRYKKVEKIFFESLPAPPPKLKMEVKFVAPK